MLVWSTYVCKREVGYDKVEDGLPLAGAFDGYLDVCSEEKNMSEWYFIQYHLRDSSSKCVGLLIG